MNTRTKGPISSCIKCHTPRLAGAFVLLLLFPGAAWGGGVVANCTEAELRAAMIGGGLVTFTCDGTITLTSTITNKANTTVDASGHNITISGGNSVGVFYVATNTTLTLITVSVADGSGAAGAGSFNDGGTLILQQAHFRSNSATNAIGMEGYYPFMCSGGGVFNRFGTVYATNSSFIGNRAGFPLPHYAELINPLKGGALVNVGGQVVLDQCDFFDNLATGPRGSSSPSGPGSPGITGLGGAIYSTGESILNECVFRNNTAEGGAGGTSAPHATGYPGKLGGSGAGGAVWNSGLLLIRNSSFESNAAVGGAGSTGCPSGNGGPGGAGHGGGLFNSGTAALENCTFGPKSVAAGGNGGNGGDGAGGGAVYAGSGGMGGLGGAGGGGGLFNLGSMRMLNCTVASNTVSGGSGGLGGGGANGIKSGGIGGNGGNGGGASGVIWSTNGLFLTNCTIAINFASSGMGGSGGAGGINTYPPIIPQSPGVAGTNGFAVGGMKSINSSLINTLLAGNDLGNCSGSLIDLGHNIGSDGTGGFTNVGSLNNTDPRLGPLADNGGATLTMALRAGSPAIDTGDYAAASPTDQRGQSRPVGLGWDIGAYECNQVTLAISPPAQTTEIGSAITLGAFASGFPPPTCQWYYNGNALADCTNYFLNLSRVEISNLGDYVLVVSNVFGALTSNPAMLNVIPPVDRRPVPGINLSGEVGSLLKVDCTDTLSPEPDWTTLDTVSLSSPKQCYFDLTTPLPPQRFYRAWQTTTPTNAPSLSLNMIPAITLTGSFGDKIRVDGINQFGPTDAWFTLDTVTLTNTSQLYFDVTAPGQPARLYRLVNVP